MQKRFAAFLASLSSLTAWAKGGLEMTQSNQIRKSDDFKFAIVIRIEGHNSRAIILRFAGIAVTLIAIGVKIAVILVARTY